MSYDLMLFNPNTAPRDRDKFMDWYNNQTEWKENHNYDDPIVTSETMQNCFLEMIETFPAMNGPYAHDDIDNPKMTDYSIGKDVIYAAFAWSEAENAYPKMLELAKKHNVGFFDVSANNGNIFFPSYNNGFNKIDNPDKESSIEEIMSWASEDSELRTVADIVYDKAIKQIELNEINDESNPRKSWWKRFFNRK